MIGIGLGKLLKLLKKIFFYFLNVNKDCNVFFSGLQFLLVVVINKKITKFSNFGNNFTAIQGSNNAERLTEHHENYSSNLMSNNTEEAEKENRY